MPALASHFNSSKYYTLPGPVSSSKVQFNSTNPNALIDMLLSDKDSIAVAFNPIDWV
jgi:hypothetical protein